MTERRGYKRAKLTSHDEDKELAKRAMTGDQKAYNVLLLKYKPIVYTAAKRRLPWLIVEDLEDITMIVLGNAFVKIHQYDHEKSKFFTWMLACLHNYVNTIPTQKKRVTAYSIEDMYPGKDENSLVEYEIPSEDRFDLNYDTKQSFTLLRTLMKELPEDIYRVMVLRFFRELSHEEIANELNIEKGNVWYKIKKGRELLKKKSKLNGIF